MALEGTADPFNAKVVRSTAAGLLALPILRLKTSEFLQLAASAQAEFLVTGDQDLLSLNPFRGTAIITVGDFLERLG